MSYSLGVSPISANSPYNNVPNNYCKDKNCIRLVPMDSFGIQQCALKNQKTKMPLWKKISNIVTFIIPFPFYWDAKGNLSNV